uniref:Uncharacterized protein n=1 Tax=Myoviridae sp. ctCo31 TaxID=2825053 RepID=A0A8S5UMG0_9CAUD|nr:MAG TPA: hypothetical protein [Myoviridae sp. ctCo31]
MGSTDDSVTLVYIKCFSDCKWTLDDVKYSSCIGSI